MIRIIFARGLGVFLSSINSLGNMALSSCQGISLFECAFFFLKEKSALSLAQKNKLQVMSLAGSGYTNTHQNPFFPLLFSL